MKYLIAIMLLLCSLVARAELFENWTTQEKVLYGTASLAMIADYKSTASVLYPNQGYKEMNPIIGEQPGNDRLTAWFVGWTIGHYFIADQLGHEDRKRYLLIVTIFETGAAAHNVSIGARINF
jgi:hypothetical protein